MAIIRFILLYSSLSILNCHGAVKGSRIKRDGGDGLDPFALSALSPIFRRAGRIGFSANEYYARNNPIIPPQFYPISSPLSQYYPEHSFLPFHAFFPPVYDNVAATQARLNAPITVDQVKLLQLLSEDGIIEQFNRRGMVLTHELAHNIKTQDPQTVADAINNGQLGDIPSSASRPGIPIRNSAEPPPIVKGPTQAERPFTTTPQQLDILKNIQEDQIPDVVYKQTGVTLTAEQLEAIKTVPSGQLANEINNRKGVWAGVESQFQGTPQTNPVPSQQAGSSLPLGTGQYTGTQSFPFLSQQTSAYFPGGKRRKRRAAGAGPAALGTPLAGPAGQSQVGFTQSQYDIIRKYYSSNPLAQQNPNVFFPRPYRPYFGQNGPPKKYKNKAKKLLDGLPPLEKAPGPKPAIPVFKPRKLSKRNSHILQRQVRQSLPNILGGVPVGRQAQPFQSGIPVGRQVPPQGTGGLPSVPANSQPVSVENCLNYLQYFPPGPGFPQGLFIDGCGRQIPAELILGPGQDTQDPKDGTPGPNSGEKPDTDTDDNESQEKSNEKKTAPPTTPKPKTTPKVTKKPKPNPTTKATPKPTSNPKSKPKSKSKPKPKSKPKSKSKPKPKSKPKSKAKKPGKGSSPTYVIYKNSAAIDRSVIRTAVKRRNGRPTN